MSKTRKAAKPKKRYAIHDNGGRPFLVDDYGGHVVVYKQEFDWNTNKLKPPVKIFTRDYKKLFVGDKPAWQEPDNWHPDFKGNSILLELAGGKYMYIGSQIYEFKPVAGDHIIKYWSEVGNSDVPYPFAVGKTHAYFFIEGKHGATMPIDFFDQSKNMYLQLWLDAWVKDCKHGYKLDTDVCKLWKNKNISLKEDLEALAKHKKDLIVKVIHERIW